MPRVGLTSMERGSSIVSFHDYSVLEPQPDYRSSLNWRILIFELRLPLLRSRFE